MMYIKVNGSKIFYTEYGQNNSKLVVFLHGLGSSSTAAWMDIPEALSTRYHTIAVDLNGFGKSDKSATEDYTIPFFGRFIKDFLRQVVGINSDKDKVIIIGHSLGGYIALDYAIENKEQIDKLVLIDSSGMLNQPTPLLERYLDAALEEEPLIRYNKVTKVFEDMLSERTKFHPVRAGIFIGTIEGEGAKHAFKSAYENSTKVSLDLGRLKQIKDIPCLVIWGKKR